MALDFAIVVVGSLILIPDSSMVLVPPRRQFITIHTDDSGQVDGVYVFADPGASWWTASVNTAGGTITQWVYAPSTQDDGLQSFATIFGGSTTNGDWVLGYTVTDERTFMRFVA